LVDELAGLEDGNVGFGFWGCETFLVVCVDYGDGAFFA